MSMMKKFTGFLKPTTLFQQWEEVYRKILEEAQGALEPQ
jgi:hypothetical protein